MKPLIATLLATLITCQSYATPKTPNKDALVFLDRAFDYTSNQYILNLKKIGEEKTALGISPIYHLSVDGIRKGERFQIAIRDSNARAEILFSAEQILGGEFATAKGPYFPIPRCSDGKPNSIASVIVSGISQGDTREILWIDPITDSIDSVSFCPFPLEVTASDGAKLSMDLASLNPFMFQVNLEHFVPAEKIRLISTYSGKSTESADAISENGTHTSWVLPDEKMIDPLSNHSYEVVREFGSLKLDYSLSTLMKTTSCPVMILITLGRTPTNEEIDEARATVQANSLKKVNKQASE